MGGDRGAVGMASPMGQEASAADDLFPRSARVIFDKHPLIQVVAQVRFPPILKIEQTPADFQDRVRGTFPFFERPATGPMPQLPAEFLQILRNQIGSGAIYLFRTDDRAITLSLTAEALTLAANTYSRWEDFIGRFHNPLAALTDIYSPVFYSRVGLRYINRIQKDALGFPSNYPWSKLIRDVIMGEAALPAFEQNIQELARRIRVRIKEPSGFVLFNHGLSSMPGQAAPAYMLDFDIYREGRIGPTDADRILDDYHTLAGRAFRWCIKPELSDALGPSLADSHGAKSDDNATDRRRS